MAKYNLGAVQTGFTKTVLWNGDITSKGTYTLNDSVNNYKMIIVEHYLLSGGVRYNQSMPICSIYTGSTDSYIVCHGNGNNSSYSFFYFSTDGLSITVPILTDEYISKIYGIN